MHLHLSDEKNKAKDEKENNGIYTFKKCLLVLDGDMKDKTQDFTGCGLFPPCF